MAFTVPVLATMNLRFKHLRFPYLLLSFRAGSGHSKHKINAAPPYEKLMIIWLIFLQVHVSVSFLNNHPKSAGGLQSANQQMSCYSYPKILPGHGRNCSFSGALSASEVSDNWLCWHLRFFIRILLGVLQKLG